MIASGLYDSRDRSISIAAASSHYFSCTCPCRFNFVASVIESLRHDRRMYTTIESITLCFNKDMQIVEKHLEIACIEEPISPSKSFSRNCNVLYVIAYCRSNSKSVRRMSIQ